MPWWPPVWQRLPFGSPGKKFTAIRERSINRRHVYTKTASARTVVDIGAVGPNKSAIGARVFEADPAAVAAVGGLVASDGGPGGGVGPHGLADGDDLVLFLRRVNGGEGTALGAAVCDGVGDGHRLRVDLEAASGGRPRRWRRTGGGVAGDR